MNKTKTVLLALGSIFFLILLGGSAFPRGVGEEFPQATRESIYQPKAWDTYEARWLIGHPVTSATGALGQISSLVIDETNGRIALVVLSDVPNLGASVLAIPFHSIVRSGQETFEFNPGEMDTGVASEISDPYMSSDPYMDAATRNSITSKFYGLPSEMDLAWLTEIYSHYSQVPYWTEKGERSPTALDLSESTQFMGAEVLYPKGEAAGRIHGLVIDSSDGHIAFLVLSDVMGRGDTLVAVPFSAFTRRGGNAFVLNATEEQLASASSFDQPEDLSNSRWAEDVYRYLGQSPYWTSGGQMGSTTMGQPMEEEKSEDEYMEP
jgi:sporulation protein YlmC with PRC-barrel domain